MGRVLDMVAAGHAGGRHGGLCRLLDSYSSAADAAAREATSRSLKSLLASSRPSLDGPDGKLNDEPFRRMVPDSLQARPGVPVFLIRRTASEGTSPHALFVGESPSPPRAGNWAPGFTRGPFFQAVFRQRAGRPQLMRAHDGEGSRVKMRRATPRSVDSTAKAVSGASGCADPRMRLVLDSIGTRAGVVAKKPRTLALNGPRHLEPTGTKERLPVYAVLARIAKVSARGPTQAAS